MPRRVSLPGADELFRATTPAKAADKAQPDPPEEPAVGNSGRVKHDEKMTIYLTAAELLAVEQARLKLRGELGRSVDRGRLVRAALELALADLDNHGMDSDLAQRLMER